MDIKPIETFYNGYRFRSRLEARWAVFFDDLGIKYEYEAEGFTLDDGRAYLPDFYLPEFNIFVEIKANRDSDDGKAERFAWSYTNFGDPYGGIVICYGDPMNRDCYFITLSESDDGGGGIYENECYWAITQNNTPVLFMDGDSRERVIGMCAYRIYNGWDLRNYTFDHPVHAELKARQARFEHGETPEGGTTNDR